MNKFISLPLFWHSLWTLYRTNYEQEWTNGIIWSFLHPYNIGDHELKMKFEGDMLKNKGDIAEPIQAVKKEKEKE